jgi:hypothetical protein
VLPYRSKIMPLGSGSEALYQAVVIAVTSDDADSQYYAAIRHHLEGAPLCHAYEASDTVFPAVPPDPSVAAQPGRSRFEDEGHNVLHGRKALAGDARLVDLELADLTGVD